LLYASIASVWADTGFGTPGGNSNGTVNNLAGGVLRTEGAALGTGAGGPLALGTEKSFANVLIDGVGSKWIVTPSSVDGGIAFMGIATHANATANVTHWMSATARSSSPASQARRARCGWTPARW